MTLLDCLHTFCGSCLKEWFTWQATQASSAKKNPFTCPSCRASVRDARPNANVTTLLELYLQANPGKARSEQDKAGIKSVYIPGQNVLPNIRRREESAEEAEDRRMVEEARDLSLRDVGIRGGGYERGVRHRARNTARNDIDTQENQSGSSTDDVSRARQINHQSSLRSILSSSDLGDSTEMEEEILRQIMDEGILEGIDLNNMNPSQEEELTEKIAEAYRRRHRHRHRQRSRSRENLPPAATRSRSQQNDPAAEQQRPRRPIISSNPNTSSATSSNPPVSRPHLLAPQVTEHGNRRRHSSEQRRQTSPASSLNGRTSSSTQRQASRSATDLSSRPRSAQSPSRRNNMVTNNRRIIDPNRLQPASQTRDRSSGAQGSISPHRRARIPASSSIVHPANTVVTHLSNSDAIAPGTGERSQHVSEPARNAAEGAIPESSPSDQMTGSAAVTTQYLEPTISCKRCDKPHLEYDLHWNCGSCESGAFHICQRCYRTGKGCLHWYGFGYAAAQRYERQAPSSEQKEPPHRLTGHRYLPPPAESVDSLTQKSTSDPATRLQSGPFCSVCAEFSPSCYWQCTTCNEGEWGFCNTCVNRGRCCTHALLPVALTSHLSTHKSPPSTPKNNSSPTPTSFAPAQQQFSGRPATTYTPLTISTHCDNCTYPIPPSTTRFHCPQCNSGDYDLCSPCYLKLMKRGIVTPENGPKGWRRCPAGHRMIVIGFEDSSAGQRRMVVDDLVGGHAPPEDDYTPTLGGGARSENDGGGQQPVLLQQYPPSGGSGMHVLALWSWWPGEGVTDELAFPKGAEVREVKDVNGDWFWGVYCGMEGVFPGAYVRVVGGG